jgi:hypothetical protein
MFFFWLRFTVKSLACAGARQAQYCVRQPWPSSTSNVKLRLLAVVWTTSRDAANGLYDKRSLQTPMYLQITWHEQLLRAGCAVLVGSWAALNIPQVSVRELVLHCSVVSRGILDQSTVLEPAACLTVGYRCTCLPYVSLDPALIKSGFIST